MIKYLLLFLTMLTLTGCEKNKEQDQAQKIATLQENILYLQNEINSLKGGIILPQIIKSDPELNNYSLFTADALGYRAIKTEVGYFVVGLSEIKPYENGYKITFNVGNPTALTYEGLKATILWGQTPKPGEAPDSWIKSLKTTQEQNSKLILPGNWHRITFVITPAQPQDTAMILFSLHVNQIDLNSEIKIPH